MWAFYLKWPAHVFINSVSVCVSTLKFFCNQTWQNYLPCLFCSAFTFELATSHLLQCRIVMLVTLQWHKYPIKCDLTVQAENSLKRRCVQFITTYEKVFGLLLKKKGKKKENHIWDVQRSWCQIGHTWATKVRFSWSLPAVWRKPLRHVNRLV